MSYRKTIWQIIFSLIYIFVILVLSSWLILIANGYKINWQAKTLQKTGMIYLKSNPKDVNIYLNNKLVSYKTPFKVTDLLPNRYYDIEVKKNLYQIWKKSFYIQAGQAEIAENIILFLENPISETPTEIEKTNFDSEFIKIDKPLGLSIKNDEIWWEDSLITRFSSKVKSAFWYWDLNHILVQINKETRIIDLDGSNNIKLFDLKNSDPIKIISKNNYLLYQDGIDIYKLKIR